jgi:uncharacterized coiled-coil protein SlyX
MSNYNTQKIDDLEIQLAHQSQEITELNEVVTAQGKEIETLKQYIKLKLSKIQESLDNPEDAKQLSVNDEAAANKPPHY